MVFRESAPSDAAAQGQEAAGLLRNDSPLLEENEVMRSLR